MDRDLQDNPDEFWRNTLLQYRKIVGKPEAIEPVADLKQIDREGIIASSITCVNQLAEHTAAAMSPVFSQAQVVLGALQYLAGTVQFHKQNYNVKGVLTRMREASGTLERIAGYIKVRQELATIEEPLLRLITQIMSLYLQLCLIYAKVDRDSKTASGKIKNSMKVLIRWDGGIGQCIEEIEKLTRQELDLNVAAMRVSDLSTTERRSKVEDSSKLRNLLQVDETDEHWVEMQKWLEQKSVSGIGDWLFDEAGEFTEWSNVQQRSQDATLWLTGPATYGKTHLCCRAIQYLRDKIEMGDWSRYCQASVAWYYRQEKRPLQSSPPMQSLKAKKSEKDSSEQRISNREKKKDPELRDILLALIWQLAESDRSFQKHAIEQFRKSPRAFAKASQLWFDLIEPFCLQPQSGDSRPRCFFLVIDGDDASDSSDTESLSEIIRRYSDSLSKKLWEKKRSCCQIRVMIARTKDAPPEAREIKVPQDSRDSDVKIFIEHRLKDLLAAWSKGSDGYRTVRSLEKRLISMFSKETVNYHVLAGLLEEISRIGTSLFKLREFERKLDPDEITKVFTSVIIPSQLRRLDQELGDEDKGILNDVISYLICVRDWPTIEQLSAFLSLSRGSSFTKNIEVEIHEKYSNIMTLSPDKYVSSEHLLTFFEDKLKQPWYARVYEDEGDEINQTHEVVLAKLIASAPDLTHLTTIISEMAKVYNRTHPKLQFDYHASHITIIKLLLSTICSEDHRERAAVTGLQEYTGMKLLWHLWIFQQTKPDLKDVTDHESMRSIGKHLCHFFMEERSVRTWLSQSDPLYLREHTCAYFENARDWLADEYVWGSFQEELECPGAPSANSLKSANDDHQKETSTSSGTKPTEDTAESASEAQAEEVPIEEEDRTEQTTVEPGNLDISAATSDQPKTGITTQPLLACVIRISASQWLEDFSWDASQALLWLITVAHEALQTQVEIDHDVGLAKNQDFLEKAYKKISSDKKFTKQDIEQAEKWAVELLKIQDMRQSLSSTQDIRIAQTLVGLKVQKKHDLAEERCAFAQDHDFTSFEATLFLSKIFEENGNKKRALDELSKIRPYIQSLEFKEKHPNRWQDELDRFWRLCTETNSVKNALIACRDLSDQPESDSTGYIAQAQEWMLRAKNLREVFSELTTIRETDGRSLLTAVLHSPASSDALFHQHLHLTLKHEPRKLLRSYADAMFECSDDEVTPHLHYWYGVSLMHSHRLGDARHEWEGLCRDIKGRAKVSTILALLFAQTAENLASVYISIAQGHELNAELHSSQVRDLEQWNDWIDDNLQYSVNYLTLLLGRLYYVTGHPRKAQRTVRNHLSTAFKLLEDDRIENDRKGYFRIAEALISLGDERNALAAWTLVACRLLYKDEYESEEIDEFSIACAGDCKWSWDGSSDLDRDLYICHDCAHVRFEESCHKKLLEGSLEQRVCRKEHRLMKVSKMKRRERERIVSGYVVVDGKAEKIDNWFTATRRQYGIPKTDQPWTERPMEYSQVTKWKIKRSFDKESRMIRKRGFGRQIV